MTRHSLNVLPVDAYAVAGVLEAWAGNPDMSGHLDEPMTKWLNYLDSGIPGILDKKAWYV